METIEEEDVFDKVHSVVDRIDRILLEGEEILVLAGAGVSMKEGLPSGTEVKETLRELTGSSTDSWIELVNSLRQDSSLVTKFIVWFNSVNEESQREMAFIRPWNHGILSCLVSGDWKLSEDLPHVRSEDECFEFEYDHQLAEGIRDGYYPRSNDPTRFKIRGYVHLITTNWDTLFERTFQEFGVQPEVISEPDDVERIGQVRRPSRTIKIDSPFLPLIPDSRNNPYRMPLPIECRKSIVCKIHGTPTYWICPTCPGFSRYRRFDSTMRIEGQVYCATHGIPLKHPALVLPGETIERSNKVLWNNVLSLARRASMLVIIGYSGSDSYIVNDLIRPLSQRTIAVKPNVDRFGGIEKAIGEDKVIPVSADDFLHALMDRFVGCEGKSACYDELTLEQTHYIRAEEAWDYVAERA